MAVIMPAVIMASHHGYSTCYSPEECAIACPDIIFRALPALANNSAPLHLRTATV